MSSEVAAQAALDVVQQVPSEVTITASAESVEFVEPRGSLVFKTDGKNGTVEVPGGSIKVKSRWDKGSLRQEFSSTQRILKRAWSVDESGHLILTQHVESVAMTTDLGDVPSISVRIRYGVAMGNEATSAVESMSMSTPSAPDSRLNVSYGDRSR